MGTHQGPTGTGASAPAGTTGSVTLPDHRLVPNRAMHLILPYWQLATKLRLALCIPNCRSSDTASLRCSFGKETAAPSISKA